MLGRLRMTIDECEAAYLELLERIFSPKRLKLNPFRASDFFLVNEKFDSDVLKGAIIDIITRKPGFEQSTLLKDPELDQQCKV